MKKIKNMWDQNRVLLVLFLIITICAFIIFGIFVRYFFGSSKSNYGNRLTGIENVTITEEMKTNFLSTMQSDELILETTLDTKGKIVYITFTFKEGVSLVEAQSKALSSLKNFEQVYLDYYDFHYTLKENATENSEGFLIMGAKNKNGSGLVWNNNTEVKIEE